MVHISSDQILLWINSFIWPLTRILGLIAIAPIFGSAAIPVRIKIGFGVMLALIVAPTLHNLPVVDPVSLPGMLILAQQFIIGIAMGFTIQIVFSSVDMAGTLISMAMGLGFASFYDPQTRGNTPAVSQFLTLVATMLFLSLNLHLALLGTLVESFEKLPIGPDASLQPGMWIHLVNTASVIFSSGVQLSLPIVAALLVTNIALGILTKAAPQLNLFGIGFPITMGVGFLMLLIIMPYLAGPLQQIFEMGIDRAILR
jgi:flagellar biosynthesis protein FliR